MKTAKRYPEHAHGWVVLDTRDAPSLRHAIGARIYHSRRGAEARAASARAFRPGVELVAVPVDGPTEPHFSLNYIDCEGVDVRIDGTITIARRSDTNA